MFNYAICNETFQGWKWEQTCRQVAELGYSAIEVAPFTLANDVRMLGQHERKATAATAKRLGLNIVGLHWLLVSPKGLSLTTNDQQVRKETADYLCHLVDLCADLQGKIMVLGSPAQRRLPSSPDPMNQDSTLALAISRLEEALIPALNRAEKAQITLCLEPLPPPEADFITNLKEAVGIIKRIQHPCLKSIFDVKSASSEQAPFEALIQTYAPYIAHVHANDANRRGPGFGQTDFRPILNALQRVNYAGTISVEVFDYTPDPITIARESLAYLRQCEPDPDHGEANV